MTIFEVMSRKAIARGAINLGQGFPDEDGPLEIRNAAARALLERPNQYPPMAGLPDLRRAVAAWDQDRHGLVWNADSEVLITSGATEALADCLNALICPGDEVILIEPLYDCYAPLVRRAGGRPVFIRLAPPDWQMTDEALDAAFSPLTKAILLNNPHNPAAKVFTRDELAGIARRLAAFDVYAICDEVYEPITFDGRPHVPLAALPGMQERCLRIGSAGKAFSLTGWKVGWVCARASLLEPVVKAHQFTTFTTPPNLQVAVAEGLAGPKETLAALAEEMQARRDHFGRGLADLGFAVAPCAGTYFIMVDIRPIAPDEDDVAFCERMNDEAGVTAIPASAFYAGDAPPRHLVRFCFAKRHAVLDDALARLGQWLGAK